MNGEVTPLDDVEITSHTFEIDSMLSHTLEAGSGSPVVLLHGGEFGANAELSWEHTISHLAATHRVIAPDWLGYGQSAKVFDFEDMIGRRLIHMRHLLDRLGVDEAPFVGASMGASMLLRDAASEHPLLRISSMVVISGGGEVPDNEYRRALLEYDGSEAAMSALVEALFENSTWHAPEYVARRHQESLRRGAWQAVAAARFSSPHLPKASRMIQPDLSRVAVPTLIIHGLQDKLKPRQYAAQLAAELVNAPIAEVLSINDAGHYPHIEQPSMVNPAITEFITRHANATSIHPR